MIVNVRVRKINGMKITSKFRIIGEKLFFI